MELNTYVTTLRQDLAASAAAGGPEVSRAGELLAGAVEPSARMVLMEVLSAAADELTGVLDPISVEVRLRGRDPEFVVTQHEEIPEPPLPPAPPTAPVEGDEGTSRITLRLPEAVKSRVEQAASAEGVSVNAWLSRAVSSALDGGGRGTRSGRTRRSGPQRFTGYARG